MTTTLTQPATYSDLIQSESYFNPYFFNGKQVNHLVFYDSINGTELIPNWDGIRWFGGGSNNDYPLMRLPFEFKKKNIIDLTSKQAFYTSYKSKYSYDKGKIVLYIPIQLLDSFQDLGENLKFETETDKQYRHDYSFKVLAKKTEFAYNKETETATYPVSDLKEFTIQFSGHYITKLKPLGKKIETITEKIKTVCPELSKYTIERMLTVCNITLK